jgi:hypothetical protein
MQSPLLRTIAIILVSLSVASIQAVGQPIASKHSRSDAIKREPLRPFSEIEALLLRGALIAAAVPAIWLLIMLMRGAIRDRRQANEQKAQRRPPDVDTSAAAEP